MQGKPLDGEGLNRKITLGSERGSQSFLMNPHRIGVLILLCLCIIWGSAWPFIKIALRDLPPCTFRTICLLCGGVGVLGVAMANGQSLTIPRHEIKNLITVSLMNITGWNLLSAYGLLHMSAGRAVIIAYTMPIWASIMGIFVLKERLNPERLLALFLGVTGLAILIGPDIKELGRTPLGPLLMLGSAFAWAIGTVLTKRYQWTMNTSLLTGWQFIFGSIPLIIGAFLLEPISAIGQISWKGGLATAYIAIIGIPVGWWAWFKVVKLLPANVAAIGIVAVPVIGVLCNALFMGEPIGVVEITSLGCVVMALVIVVIGRDGLRRLMDWKKSFWPRS